MSKGLKYTFSSKGKDTITSGELVELMNKPKFSGQEITDGLNYLLGRVLTIVDSSIIDPRQNKAMKDLVKGEFLDDICLVSEKVSDGKIVAVTDEEFKQCVEVNPLNVVGEKNG